MSFLVSRKAQMVSGETIKWIIAVAVIVAVGFAVRNIVLRVSG